MKNLFYITCLSLFLCSLYSCETVHLTPLSRQSHSSYSQRSSNISCFFSGLDRTVWEGVSVEPPGETDLRVISGFKTTFVGGSQPFPCNKLYLMVVSGRFDFDLSTINAARLHRAYIVVDNFTPIGKNILQEAVPWGLGTGAGWIGEPGRIHDDCQFKIKFVTDLPATSTEFESPPPPSRELSVAGQTFSVVNGGSGDRFINVMSEIKSLLETGGSRPIFLVEPAGYSVDYQASNRFVGNFTIRLNVELFLE